jgi:hypothetical protein
LPYASAAIVNRNISVHRNPSNVRDDGRRPLSGTGWARICTDLAFRKSEIFFILGLDMNSANQKLLPDVAKATPGAAVGLINNHDSRIAICDGASHHPALQRLTI